MPPNPESPERLEPPLPPAQHLANELQIHRTELEMQHRELREAQLAIETSRQRYFALFDQAPVGYFTFGERHALLDVNLAGAALLGRPRAEVSQFPFSYFLTEDCRPAFHALLDQSLQGQASAEPQEFGVNLPNGQHHRVMVRAVRLQQAEGKPATVLVAGFDVTRIRDAERRERELAERLREARHLESLGRLAGGIAHDFNNLLQIISVSLDLLADDPRAEDRADSLRAARSAIDRSSLLTRQIMVYSQRTPVSPVAIELPGLLETMSPVLRSFMQGGARLVIDADPEAPGVVADTAQLEQVILNLIVNAADAVGSSGTVMIRTLADRLPHVVPPGTPARPDQPAVLLEVCDTGSGMTPETQARIFEPFFTTKPPGRGTGLGLSLVHAIITRHGGRIDVQSRVGAGTTFQVRWPAAPVDVVRVAPPAAMPEMIDPDGAVILVAEDDPVVRRITERLLRRRGFEVILATDGAEAVDRFNAHAASGIDLLLFDIAMPRLSGTDAYNVIRHHPACPPILFVSGVPEDVPAPTSARIRFLRKPYSESELFATLAALREEAMR